MALKPGDGANHSRMLDPGGDDVAAEPAVGQGGALDRVVDRLGAAGGENDFLRLGGIHQLGQARSRRVDAISCFEAKLVQ